MQSTITSACDQQNELSSSCGLFEFRAAGRRPTRRLADILQAGDAIDLDTLGARLLVRSPIAEGATAWRGIRATPLEPAGAPLVDEERAPDSEKEAARELLAALRNAVARSLDGVRCVAVMSGGGLDSAGLLALAVEWAKQDARRSVLCVAMDFEGPGDDRPYLRALEEHLGCDVVRVSPEEAAPRLAHMREGVDASPLTWIGGAFEIATLSRARALGAERVLTGAGGDWLFDGDPTALADRFVRGDRLGAIAAASGLDGFGEPRSRALSWIFRPLVARLEPRAIRRRRIARLLNAPEWAGPRLRRLTEAHRPSFVDHALLPRRNADERIHAACTSPELEHLAWLHHQQEVATGLPRRDPYLDRALRRFVLSLPPEWLLAGDVRRGLYREAIRVLVPAFVANRKTKAEMEPAITRLVEAAGGFEALRDLAKVQHLADLGLVEPRQFLRVFDSIARDPLGSWDWFWAWPALAAEAFVARHAR